MATHMISNNSHSNCPCTHARSSGAMESHGMPFLMKIMHTVMDAKIYHEYIINDDDNNMKKYLTCPEKRPASKNNIGGRLPKTIPQPKWFVDPTQ